MEDWLPLEDAAGAELDAAPAALEEVWAAEEGLTTEAGVTEVAQVELEDAGADADAELAELAGDEEDAGALAGLLGEALAEPLGEALADVAPTDGDPLDGAALDDAGADAGTLDDAGADADALDDAGVDAGPLEDATADEL